MNTWLSHRLAPARAVRSGVVLVVDCDQLVEPALLQGDVVAIEDWWSLRRVYELDGRHRSEEIAPLIFVISGDLIASPLPWDIEQACAVVVVVKLPGPPSVRAALASLEGDEAERAIAAVAADDGDSEAALIRAVTGIPIDGARLRRADQLRLAARLAVRPNGSIALAKTARRWILEPVAASLLDDPPDSSRLQDVWQSYVSGTSDDWAVDLEQASAEMSQLFAVDLLEPVVAGRQIATWAMVGARRPSAEERARDLLADASPELPTDFAGWCDMATWWGEVRRLIAGAPSELRDQAWNVWTELDSAFLPWLQSRYGTLLSSAAQWPTAVHRIAHFLARRLREDAADRILLIVLDGLGHTQWTHLREQLPLEVIEAGSTLALVPTYTTISRQAIFAGDLPSSFPDTLWTTQREPRLWQELWLQEGFPVTAVRYQRVRGRLPVDHLELGDVPVNGVVVNAVDDLMHTSELFGDAQLLANIDVWADNGFLVDLLTRARAEGIETWITADHGNLECIGSGSVSEGIAIESTGKRLLRYPNRTLRDSSSAEGIVWDPIPGMPSTAEPLLFAGGRRAFTNNRVSISHGGLSLDEVLVPLVRVTV